MKRHRNEVSERTRDEIQRRRVTTDTVMGVDNEGIVVNENERLTDDRNLLVDEIPDEKDIMATSSNRNPGAPPPRRFYKTVFDLFQGIETNIVDNSLQQVPVCDGENGGQKWLDQRVQFIIQNVLLAQTFSPYLDGNPVSRTFSKNNLDKIVRRFYVFHNKIARNAFRMHTKGMYSTANGLLVEFTASIARSGPNAVRRGSFDLKKFESKLSSWKPWADIHSEGTYKMKNTRLRADSYYPYIYDSNCRGLLQSLMIHTTGVLGMACSLFENNSQESTPKHPNLIIKSLTSSTVNGFAHSLHFNINTESLNFFRGSILPAVIDDILKLANNVYEWWILTVPINDRVRYGKVPSRRRHTSEKWYINNAEYPNILTPNQLIEFIMGDEEYCLDFWAKIGSHLFHSFLVKGQALFGEIVREEQFDVIYLEAMRSFYKSLHELTMTTIHDTSECFENGNQNAEQLIALLRERRDLWITNIINVLKQYPIRYIETGELENILLHEGNSRVEHVTLIDPTFSTASGVGGESTEIDIDATVDRFDKDIVQVDERNGANFIILCIQEPPDGCLDEVGKCKSCGIDWSKLDGRVQIMRCKPGTNVEYMNEILRRTINTANEAINNVIEQSRTGGDISRNDDNEESVKHLQLQVPIGRNAQETVQTDSTIINQMLRFSITLTEGLHGINNRSNLDVAPLLVNMIFNRIRSLTNRRRITEQASGGEDAEDVDRPAIGSEVTVSMTEEVAHDAGGQDNENRRFRVDIQKKTPVPIVPDEVINDIIQEVGLGAVNPNRELSFSNAENNEDRQAENVTRRAYVLRSAPISREDDASSDIPIRLTIEGLDATNARNITILYILTKWVKEGRFAHARLASVEKWVKMNIVCSTGPLSEKRDYNQPKNAIAACNNFEEIIGTYSILTAYDLYYQIHDALVTSSNWNDVGEHTHTRLHRYEGDEQSRGVTYMNFRISQRDNIRRQLSLYTIVVVYQYNRRIVSGRNQPILVCRRLGIVTRIDNVNEQTEQVDVVRVMEIVKCQPSVDEDREQQYVERNERDIDYLCYIKNVGYTGPSIRYSDYQNSIRSQPLSFTNILKQQRTIGNQHRRIIPFTDSIEIDHNDVAIFINNNCNIPFRRHYFNLLYGISALVSDGDPNGTISTEELPSLPMPAQITAIVKVCECVDENMNITQNRMIDSQVFTIVGPAGTGKTTTLVQIINALLNRESVASDITLLYSRIEQEKAGIHGGTEPQLSAPPEDVIRILVVTETNQALEEIEMRINRCILLRWDDNSLRLVIPMYSKVATRHNSEHDTIPPLYDVPDDIRRRYTGPITLTTVGSIQKAFSHQQFLQSRANRGLPQYDVVIMDEASQIGVRSWIMSTVISQPALHSTSKVTYIVCGDPYQNTPMSFGPRSRFTKLSSVSIMDLLLPTSTKQDYSFAPWVQLNVQFRMHELISRLSNNLSNREVHTHQSVARATPGRIFNPFFHLVNDTFEPIRTGFAPLSQQHHTCPIVWVNPYDCKISLRSAPDLPDYWHRMYNISFLEAVTVTNLVENIVDEGVFECHQVLILTPYNQQVSLISELLRLRYHHLRRTHDAGVVPHLDEVSVSTVGSIQGAERDCVVFSAVRNRRDRGGRIGILGELNTTYVAITRAKFKLYIVADNRYLRRFDVWKEVTSFLNSNVIPPEE